MNVRVTELGYVNRNEQRVVRAGLQARTHFGAVSGAFELECGRCGERHRANAADIVHRKCPCCEIKAIASRY
jgi:hypothetical protein